MARGKSTKLHPYEKILTLMISGKPVTVEEIDALLGKEIYMYRLSTYMWHIKTQVDGVIKPIKEGRKVLSYQLINVDAVKKFMKRSGVNYAGFTPGQVQSKASKSKLASINVNTLSDLNAQPVVNNQTPTTETEKLIELAQ